MLVGVIFFIAGRCVQDFGMYNRSVRSIATRYHVAYLVYNAHSAPTQTLNL